MTDLQIWLLVSPGILLAIGGGLAIYARYDARQMIRGTTRRTDTNE